MNNYHVKSNYPTQRCTRGDESQAGGGLFLTDYFQVFPKRKEAEQQTEDAFHDA